MPNSLKTALWLAWAAAAMVLTAGMVRWQVQYFRSPGPEFFRAAMIGLPLLAIGTLAWPRVRTGFLWRYELAAITAIPVAAALLQEPRGTIVVVILFAACYCAGRIWSSPWPPESRCLLPRCLQAASPDSGTPGSSQHCCSRRSCFFTNIFGT